MSHDLDERITASLQAHAGAGVDVGGLVERARTHGFGVPSGLSSLPARIPAAVTVLLTTVARLARTGKAGAWAASVMRPGAHSDQPVWPIEIL
ncbi:hypothetical protein [Actinoplanes philippinensis]|uniref:hypothetical protein n=1 Tax=Actinoplanes philippinensis TaxID=35752 RepID=UPI0033E32542